MSGSIRGWVGILLLAMACTLPGEESPSPPPPTWEDLIAQGVAPYRQLSESDFAIDDKAHPKNSFHISTAIQPRYHFTSKPYNGFAFAYIDRWMVFSGFNKKDTSRKSAFKEMKAALPFAQALLDINEIHARRLAALKEGELPSARGNSFEEVQAELARKLKDFLAVKYQENNTEMETFAKATKNGADQKKVRALAAEIAQRLKETPADNSSVSCPGVLIPPPPETGQAASKSSRAKSLPKGETSLHALHHETSLQPARPFSPPAVSPSAWESRSLPQPRQSMRNPGSRLPRPTRWK